ncbi:MAG TPA: hypothetical protein VL443_04690, partial [Cyclobacteriaceae bacterium]|nr:hypothetical protein [Cyclobacteriaceae bacterium]
MKGYLFVIAFLISFSALNKLLRYKLTDAFVLFFDCELKQISCKKNIEASIIRNMKKLLLLIGLALMALSSKCQSDFVPGFVISLQNDTIRGYLNNMNISESAYKCSFKKSID